MSLPWGCVKCLLSLFPCVTVWDSSSWVLTYFSMSMSISNIYFKNGLKLSDFVFYHGNCLCFFLILSDFLLFRKLNLSKFKVYFSILFVNC
jgi:hypothetical protein